MKDSEEVTEEANDGNKREEEEEELRGVVHVSNPSTNVAGGRSAANSNSNNEESLGEIWFDTMRRSRRQGGFGSNSTPSSPSDSCEQEQETSSDTSSAPKGEEQTSTDQQDPSTDPQDTSQAGNGKIEEQDHKTASSRQGNNMKRGGYQSDDEGGYHFNTSSGSGSGSGGSSNQGDAENGNETGPLEPTSSGVSTSSNSSYLDAVTLMGLHKQAQAEERERLKQQEVGEPPKKKAKSLSDAVAQRPTTLAEQVAKLQATHNATSATSMAKKPAQAASTSTGTDTNAATKPTPSAPDATSSNTTNAAGPNNTNSEGNTTANNQPQIRKLQRLERNAREKERSGKITDQFQVLKQILTDSGVVVPKGTKGSILSIVRAYILNMQQQQRQKEKDNEALKQQILNIAQGSLGMQAAHALHLAAHKNGLTQQLPPPPPNVVQPPHPQLPASQKRFDPLRIVSESDYHKVWDSCPVGIAIATMGGTFLDCNQVFRSLLNCSKSHLRTLSVFHLLQAKPDNVGGKSNLQMAFEQISKLVETVQTPGRASPIVLSGSIEGHEHLGVGVSLIHSAAGNTNGLDGHQLCVTVLQSGVMATSMFQGGAGPTTEYPKQFLPAPLVPLRFKTAIPQQRQQQQQQQQRQRQQQHALTTILTNSAPMPGASSSLSSSGSSNQNQNSNGGDQQKQQEQQQQLQQPQDPRYYTVG